MKKLRDFKTDGTLDTAAASKYAGLSEDELTRELYKKASEAKNEGTFDFGELQRFYSMMSPHLSKEQRARLETLMNALK